MVVVPMLCLYDTRGESEDLSLSCALFCREVGNRHPFSVCLSILAWRFSQAFFEDLCKVTLTLKANRERYLREGPIGLFEEPLGCFKSCTDHKLVRRFARGLAKEMGKMIRGEANLLGQGF